MIKTSFRTSSNHEKLVLTVLATSGVRISSPPGPVSGRGPAGDSLGLRASAGSSFLGPRPPRLLAAAPTSGRHSWATRCWELGGDHAQAALPLARPGPSGLGWWTPRLFREHGRGPAGAAAGRARRARGGLLRSLGCAPPTGDPPGRAAAALTPPPGAGATTSPLPARARLPAGGRGGGRSRVLEAPPSACLSPQSAQLISLREPRRGDPGRPPPRGLRCVGSGCGVLETRREGGASISASSPQVAFLLVTLVLAVQWGAGSFKVVTWELPLCRLSKGHVFQLLKTGGRPAIGGTFWVQGVKLCSSKL